MAHCEDVFKSARSFVESAARMATIAKMFFKSAQVVTRSEVAELLDDGIGTEAEMSAGTVGLKPVSIEPRDSGGRLGTLDIVTADSRRPIRLDRVADPTHIVAVIDEMPRDEVRPPSRRPCAAWSAGSAGRTPPRGNLVDDCNNVSGVGDTSEAYRASRVCGDDVERAPVGAAVARLDAHGLNPAVAGRHLRFGADAVIEQLRHSLRVTTCADLKNIFAMVPCVQRILRSLRAT